MSEPETDPMLGEEATRDAYMKGVMEEVEREVEETKKQVRAAASSKETQPVMLGHQGFTGGISSA